MIDKVTRSLLLLTVTIALPQSGLFGAEPLPPHALARIGDHRFYHGPDIICAVLSPDGRRAASAARYPSDFQNISDKERDAYDPVIVLWDAATGERLRTARIPNGVVWRLVFSPDCKQLAAAYSISHKMFGVVVFAVETGKLLWQRDFKQWVEYLQYSADGKQLRVSEWRGPVSAWNPATGKQLRLWKPPPEEPRTKKKLGVCGRRGVLSPDGKVIAWEMCLFLDADSVSESVGLRVQDATTNKLLYQIQRKGDKGDWPQFAFSLKGELSVADGHKLTVYETATGKEMLALDVPEMVNFVLAPNGRRAMIYGTNSRMRLWDLATGKPAQDLCTDSISILHSLPQPQAFCADGTTVLAATHSTLLLFNAATGKERGVSAHRAAITPRFSSDGRKLFTSSVERRCSWDVSGKEPVLLRHQLSKVWEIETPLAHSADELLFLDHPEGRVRVRETATGRVLCDLENAENPDYGRFSVDASRVLLSYEDDNRRPEKVWLYDAKTGKKSAAIQLREAVSHAVFVPDGRHVAWTDRSGAVHFHDAATGKAVRSLRCSRPLRQQRLDKAILFFSRDGEYLFEGWPTLPTRVLQVSSGRVVAWFPANPDKASEGHRLSSMACSPDSRLLAVAEWDSGTIRLLEIASGKARVEFAGHRHGVHGLTFSPDGKTLASGGEDNIVFLWDVTGAKTPAASKATDNDLTSLWNDLASDDGQRVGLAIASLPRKPEASVAFLQEHLRPAEAIDKKRLAQLIADLDADAFEAREAASRELTRLGERAEAALRRALMNRPLLEARRRIEDVLSKLEPSPPPPEMLRTLRAIEVLEHIGTPAARRCLQRMAEGATDARPTRDATAALRRLTKKRE